MASVIFTASLRFISIGVKSVWNGRLPIPLTRRLEGDDICSGGQNSIGIGKVLSSSKLINYPRPQIFKPYSVVEHNTFFYLIARCPTRAQKIPRSSRALFNSGSSMENLLVRQFKISVLHFLNEIDLNIRPLLLTWETAVPDAIHGQ